MTLHIRRRTLVAAIGTTIQNRPAYDRARVKLARAAWAKHRASHGFAELAPKLLTPPAGNLKLAKSAAWGLALAPYNLSGYNACPASTRNCRQGCVAKSGKGALPAVMAARVARTTFLAEHPREFATLLADELVNLPHGAYVRLNTFSDLPWETLAPWIFQIAPDVTFYDYTKIWGRVTDGELPTNYHVALSASERTTDDDIYRAIAHGHSVAVVYSTKRGHDLPTSHPVPCDTWPTHKAPVVDADKSDRWMVEYSGVIGGLRAKGDMIRNPGKMVRSV